MDPQQLSAWVERLESFIAPSGTWVKLPADPSRVQTQVITVQDEKFLKACGISINILGGLR